MSESSVLALVFNPTKDKVLLIHRRDTPVWVLPGGGVDSGESPEDAVIREVLEETGLQGSIVRKIAIYSPINRLAQTTHFFEIFVENLDLLNSPTKPNQKIKLMTGAETKEINFFSLNQLPPNFFHIHKNMIGDALLEGELIEKELTEVTYWNLFKYFMKHPICLTRFAFSKLGIPINSK